jgi:uncharacterized Zn-binding protein involved in type VI secretion
MPVIITESDLTQGHCWAPTIIEDTSKLYDKVLINNKKVVRFGDKYQNHVPGCTSPPTTHPVIASLVASPTVFVGGIAVLRDGDPLSCGDVANSLGSNVFSDGGGFGPVTSLSTSAFGPSSTTGYSINEMELIYPVASANIYAQYRRFVTLGQGAQQNITYQFQDWCGPLSIKPEWRIKIIEEGTGVIYYNTINGTAGLPQLAPGVDQFLRSPIPVKFNYTGNLPAGIAFNHDTGEVYGTPETLNNLPNTIQINGYINNISTETLRTKQPVPLTIKIERVIISSNGVPTNIPCPEATY